MKVELSARFLNTSGERFLVILSVLICFSLQSTVLYSSNPQPDCCHTGEVCGDSLPHALQVSLHLGQLQEGGAGGLGPLHLPRTSCGFYKGNLKKYINMFSHGAIYPGFQLFVTIPTQNVFTYYYANCTDFVSITYCNDTDDSIG